MNLLSVKSGIALSALATLTLVVAACSGDSAGASDSTTEPAPSAVVSSAAADADDGSAGEDAATEEEASEAPAPEEASDEVAVVDAGPAAAPGAGRLEVGGKTYDLTIASCEFNGEGPAEGSFEVTGSDSDGHDFEMTQFFLNGEWSQSDVQLDLGKTKIYVIRSSASDGAEPAAVDGSNVTWVESYRELDEAANAQVELGEGTLNFTCA